MKNKKIITPQDQVKNKVNTGIMDAVTMGGMMEENSNPIEDDRYTIGIESNGDFAHINENDENNFLDVDMFTSIGKFMEKEGLNVKPFPAIDLDWSEQSGLFIKTGYYLPNEKKIVLFCKDRHPKDILRSYAHEMIHHMQNLDGQNMNFSSKDDVKDNKKLEKLESEAYLKGNIYFRKWTEYERSKGDKSSLNESFYRLLSESPDSLEHTNLTYESPTAIPFLTYEGYDDVFIGFPGSTHENIYSMIYDTVFEKDSIYEISDELREAIENRKVRIILGNYFDLFGRYWEEEKDGSGNIISFYNYNLKSLQKKYSTIVRIIKQIEKETHLNIDLNTLDFDHWTNKKASRFPLKWIGNGLAEILMDMADKIVKTKINGQYIYVLYAKNGQIVYFDVNGNYVDNSVKNVISERILSRRELQELTQNMEESLTPDEVDLTSFNIKKELNPKFWKDGRLDSRIRIKLLDIADDFIDFLGVDWVKPEDITITGSLANFNWDKKHSDIDLHILMDYSKVDERVDFVDRYFYSLKELWNEEHKDLKIFGFPIEVFVQDTKKEHTSSGVYSLEKDKWLEEPEREKLSKQKVNKNKIKNSVSKYTKKIDALYERSKEMKTDEYKARKVYEDAENLFDEIKNLRRKDLSNSGNEINEGNIIFKCLRRLGYIEKLDNIINKGYNAFNSLS